MLEQISRCYERFRLITYRSMFRLLRERDSSLSAAEAYAVDVIHLLHGPTIKEFADCLGISQPNATYKVNHLIQKGYVHKIPSRRTGGRPIFTSPTNICATGTRATAP